MNRRDAVLALVALGAAAAPRIAWPQAQPARIGFLAPLPRHRMVFLPAILKRLAELGYVEGKTLVLEYRSADLVSDRFPALARELIQAKCDLIFAVGTEEAARALLESKAPVPGVILAINYDPVRAGIISNLRRPGGNVTGMFIQNPPLEAKRLEILRETVPTVKRFLVLADSFTKEGLEVVRSAAERLRLEMIVETFATPPYDVESVFARTRGAAGAVIIFDSPTFFDQRRRIAELVMKHRLPSVVNVHYFDQAGFLLSYGVNFNKAFFRAGDIAASILKGAKPGDIPLEQPTDFELAVNLSTAKALGISVPASIMARAGRVIE